MTKKVRGHGKPIEVRDKRTKAELIKQLSDMIKNYSELMEKQINPPVVIAEDSENFDAGFKAGVKAQQEWYAEHPWWKLW